MCREMYICRERESYAYMYIYIYIHRERERLIYVDMSIYGAPR